MNTLPESATSNETGRQLELNAAGDVMISAYDETLPAVPKAGHTTPARLWRRRAFIPAALVSTVAAFTGWRLAVIHDLQRRQSEAFQKLQGQVRIDVEGATAEDLAAVKRHRAALVRDLMPRYEAALAAVPAGSQELGSFTGCFHVIMRQAMDMVKGTSSAQEYIAGRLGGVVSASTNMQSLTASALGALSHEVGGRVHQMAARWLQGAEQLPAGAPGGQTMQPLAEMVGSVDGHIRELKNATAFGIAEATVAVMLNRQLLVPLFRRFAERAASTVGANIALAVSDGPLPFGEIVGVLIDVGVGIWTAWDIYWLSHELPGRIASSLRDNLGAMQDEVLAHYDRQAARILTLAAQARAKAAAPILALNSSQLTTQS